MNKLIISGPQPARIMFVGEAPGDKEVETGRPLTGPSGWEFSKMCSEAGIVRESCFITNLLQERPPGKIEDLFYKKTEAKLRGVTEFKGRYPAQSIIDGYNTLQSLIVQTRPNVIVPLGDAALWALTGNSGITKWRGSTLSAKVEGLDYEPKIIPTFNPAGVLRNWPWRWMVVNDLKRVAAGAHTHEISLPDWSFILRPSLQTCLDWLGEAKGKTLVCDIETRGYNISCIGFALDKHNAICIPMMLLEEPYSYWSPEDELAITLKLKELFEDKSTTLIFHNAFFDMQVIARQWGFIPANFEDTMVMQHVAFAADMPKSLAFCASMYCNYYCFWKDDGKEWNIKEFGEDTHWEYNATDCAYTYEVYEMLVRILKAYNLSEQYAFQRRLMRSLLMMMFRGIKVDTAYKQKLNIMLLKQIQEHNQWFEDVLGHPLNPSSNPQMKMLFHNDFKAPIYKHKKTKQPTLDDEALKKTKEKIPLLRPLVDGILEVRSLGVFRNTFALAEIDEDNRARCLFNPARVETYRLSSSQNIFGTGLNLQTIPKGREDE